MPKAKTDQHTPSQVPTPPSHNLDLWNRVFKTDPSQTKPFQKGGGFKGTAIKPFWLIKRATEEFGPIGMGWGYDIIETRFEEKGVFALVRVWYSFLNGKTNTVETAYVGPQWGATLWFASDKQKFLDEEAPKKAVTDGLTKCLSYIGFAGDIHMGLFDDSKYVDKRQAEEDEKEKLPTHQEIVEYNEFNDLVAQDLAAKMSLEEITKYYLDIKPEIAKFTAMGLITTETIALFTDRKKELAGA